MLRGESYAKQTGPERGNTEHPSWATESHFSASPSPALSTAGWSLPALSPASLWLNKWRALWKPKQPFPSWEYELGGCCWVSVLEVRGEAKTALTAAASTPLDGVDDWVQVEEEEKKKPHLDSNSNCSRQWVW